MNSFVEGHGPEDRPDVRRQGPAGPAWPGRHVFHVSSCAYLAIISCAVRIYGPDVRRLGLAPLGWPEQVMSKTRFVHLLFIVALGSSEATFLGVPVF